MKRIVLLLMGLLVILPTIAVFIGVTSHTPTPHVSISAPSPHVTPTVHPTPKPPSHKLPPILRKPAHHAKRYVVKAGDNLWAIAQHFHIKGGWPQLYHLNMKAVGSNPNLIHVGLHLTL